MSDAVEAIFAIPGAIDAPTGGYAYARRVLPLLRDFGVAAAHLPLPASFPHPTPEDLSETSRLLADAPPGAVLLIDGLAYGALPAGLVRGLGRPVVALVHHPLGYESGLSPEREAQLLDGEREVLALAARVLVSSTATARLLAEEFDVPSPRIVVAQPGTDPAPRAHGTGSPVRVLAVGAVSARKYYDGLVAALAPSRARDWHLTIAGSLERSPDAVAALGDAIARHDLSERVTLAGAVGSARLAELFSAADLFVSNSRFEGYGMGLAEAMAHGLPLVASTGGAAGETVPDEAALKVEPEDEAGLSTALAAALSDAALRARLAQASWEAGRRLPRWERTAQCIAEVIREVAR